MSNSVQPSKRVLILCTGNSCRSQMAEAFWNKLGEGRWHAFSAGSHPAGYVHPMAVDVMGELDLDLSANRSKHLSEFQDQPFDLVVTVCDSARESCPVCPGAKQTVHWPFDDPAKAEGSGAEMMAVFRRVRDEIQARVTSFLANAMQAQKC